VYTVSGIFTIQIRKINCNAGSRSSDISTTADVMDSDTVPLDQKFCYSEHGSENVGKLNREKIVPDL
jgi:hypothetical protein